MRKVFARKRELAKEDPRLGKIADKKLARSLGVSHTTVQNARIALGIPAYDPNGERRAKIESDPELGCVVDRVLAKRYNVSVDTIFNARLRLNIQAKKTNGSRRSAPTITNLMQGWGR